MPEPKCAKNYENWLAIVKVIAKIISRLIFWPTLYICMQTMHVHTDRHMLHSQRNGNSNRRKRVYAIVAFISYKTVTDNHDAVITHSTVSINYQRTLGGQQHTSSIPVTLNNASDYRTTDY